MIQQLLGKLLWILMSCSKCSDPLFELAIIQQCFSQLYCYFKFITAT